MMGATLSNMGCNPTTGQSAFNVASVKDVLSVMFTCGMHDYSGQWAYRVGVPAKSGVAGGLIAVVNRQMGIATYSPRLDRVRQQLPRNRSLHRAGLATRPPRVRLPQHRLWLPGHDVVGLRDGGLYSNVPEDSSCA